MNIEDLNEIINNRVKSRKKNSYTNKLLKLGPKKIAQKFGEESSELIIDFLQGSKKRTIEEAVGVIYHLLILLKSKKITMNENYKASKEDLNYYKQSFESILFNKDFIGIFDLDNIKDFILEIS